MKKKAFCVLLFLGMSLFGSTQEPILDKVTVNKRQILVNNKPYIIKGICYHPVPIGKSERSFESIDKDLALMTEAGVNTIRVYSPIDDLRVLNKIDAAGLKVIIGFGYSDPNDHYNIRSGNYLKYINTYKNHNAILMWELGNEYNYHPEWFNGDLKNWYHALNNAAKAIHDNDLTHPVTTAHGDLPSNEALSLSANIDVWGMNVYRMTRPESIYPEWKIISDKPMYFSEGGADSYMAVSAFGYQQGENQKAQADAVKTIVENTFNSDGICAGITVFSFTDGWWKAGKADVQDIGGWAPEGSGVPFDRIPNEEYWGIVDINRNKKEVFDVLKDLYLKQ
ncbi:MAG: glycoside hydrolase family 2 TIM barrel-domain containing protein [Flavobacteriaceae bacterium]|jgi:beta-galactosidase/beta-glucuronidase|nr:hypothetical protein [Flavobacteriaceae bacterium]MDG1379289.1 glycoside hydrolase family 2 TIM barrel-domain containing protein [Flavobacteriaceae bacterium]MDG2349280.1 glycoside hydrolase family 2 TIM barrel-domain containing protein [Flavobacteriaceae bacterium]